MIKRSPGNHSSYFYDNANQWAGIVGYFLWLGQARFSW